MKSLKYSDLKGSRTAIHCSTQEEWDKVTEICGYEWTGGRWDKYAINSAINMRLMAFADVQWHTRMDYTIIPASDFIAANSEGECTCEYESEGHDYDCPCRISTPDLIKKLESHIAWFGDGETEFHTRDIQQLCKAAYSTLPPSTESK